MQVRVVPNMLLKLGGYEYEKKKRSRQKPIEEQVLDDERPAKRVCIIILRDVSEQKKMNDRTRIKAVVYIPV